MAKFFIERPIFAWVIALFVMVLGSVATKVLADNLAALSARTVPAAILGMDLSALPPAATEQQAQPFARVTTSSSRETISFSSIEIAPKSLTSTAGRLPAGSSQHPPAG